MKIVFDNSIHLGQFCIRDERLRVAAKNSQVMISDIGQDLVIGIESFNENSYTDHTIWALERSVQDVFYPFMDVYHSLKHVVRVPLQAVDARLALELHRDLELDLSNALTCALAIRYGANEIHTFYSSLRQPAFVQRFHADYGVRITVPEATLEKTYTPKLEQLYNDAMTAFRQANINLPDRFHE